ncbi:hypothetical protein R1T08_06900 [Streptomyces sp. SBC-4]|nr:hypothetical protein [Streptomyces sp. SBC-4]MDV5143998.1 hypothetical protein [Streptomyces sp. SBC-4]
MSTLADTADHEDIADVLQALYDDHRDRRDGSVLGMVSGLITDLGIRVGDQADEDIARHAPGARPRPADQAGGPHMASLDPELHHGGYLDDAALLSGAVAHLDEPFPIAFDPGSLVRR